MRVVHPSLSILVAIAITGVGCTTEIGPRDRRDGGIDASVTPGLDARVGVDSSIEGDAWASAPDGAPGTDARPPPAPDTGPACTPTHTSCRGELECGAVPDGCPGGSIDCGECAGGETWCAVLEMPGWLARIRSCVPSVIAAHPEYFDATMPCSADSPLVLDARAAEYVRDVAACMDGDGAVAIVDPNAPVNEIRVRAVDGDVADNYPVRVYSTGCTRQAYTSSCTPAFF